MAGQNATLKCRPQVPKDDVITVLEWKKPDLKKYVFFFRGDDNKNGEHQDNLFLNRVQLRDPGMKDGDVSVVLNNVTVNDSGKYECYVLVKPKGLRRRRREAHEPKLVSVIKLSVTEPDIKNITVTAGQNVTLKCQTQVSEDDVIAVLQWMKPDLKKYVFYFNDPYMNGVYQDERFHNRVQLRDPEMKDGDVSVVLNNVTANDSGTYECRVLVEPNGSSRVQREAHEHVSIIKLSVTEPGTTDRGTGGGNQDGPFGLTAAAAALFGVIVTVVIGVLIRRRKKSDQPAGDDDAEQQTLSS